MSTKKPSVFDEDCPESTTERALKFRRVNQKRKGTKKHILFSKLQKS